MHYNIDAHDARDIGDAIALLDSHHITAPGEASALWRRFQGLCPHLNISAESDDEDPTCDACLATRPKAAEMDWSEQINAACGHTTDFSEEVPA